MSWQEDYKTEEPCKCGKGKIVTTVESDDWGRSRQFSSIQCEECQKKYELKSTCERDRKNIVADGYELVEKK